MKIRESGRTRLALLACVAGVALSGCGHALVYGEGTNFSLATLRVNDDPATPLRVVSGLDRTVATIAPQTADGQDAVNMLSDFQLAHPRTSMLGAFGDTLEITTEFVSGAAASGARKDSAQKIMGFR